MPIPTDYEICLEENDKQHHNWRGMGAYLIRSGYCALLSPPFETLAEVKLITVCILTALFTQFVYTDCVTLQSHGHLGVYTTNSFTYTNI